MLDQRGCQHTYVYDGLGRQIHDRVTAMGTGTVGAARRISTTYDIQGRVSLLTTWDNATVGLGNVLNQVQNLYNDFGQQTYSIQDHSGAVTVLRRELSTAMRMDHRTRFA